MKAQPPIIVIDIGNTSTSVGCYAGRRVTRVHRVETHRSTPAAVRRLVREALAGRIAGGAMIASVVPRMDDLWRDTLERLRIRPVGFVTHRLQLGVSIRYSRPDTIGADRLANACAGVDRYGAPLIVADFGTAVTFDVITRRGYEGGIIAPGLPLAYDYLAEKTAKLPHLRDAPVRGPWGRSTEQAMRLGARWGYSGLVRGILSELRRHPALQEARLVLTGGHGRIISKTVDENAILDPTLTLYGVGRLFELNHGPEA